MAYDCFILNSRVSSSESCIMFHAVTKFIRYLGLD